MAYADANTTNRKLGTGAAVLLIEAGLGIALVTGLANDFVRTPDVIVDTFNIPKPKDPPPPPPPTGRQARDKPSVIDRPDVLVKLPPVSGPVSTEDLVTDSGADSTSGIGEVVFPRDPDPVATPEPLFKPRSAAPRGKWKQWVTTNDYPTHDLRLEHQGVTRYRLAIDTGGTVTDCTVTVSSGWPGLDKAACDNVKRRARFEPATDQTGARTSGSFSGSVAWQIPKE